MPKYNFKLLSVLFILVGAGLLIYDMTQAENLIFFKIFGIVSLMLGLYLLNTTVKSKEEND